MRALNAALRSVFERFELHREDGALRVQPLLNGDEVWRIVSGASKPPAGASVKVAGTFEHEGSPAVLVQVDGPPALRASNKSQSPR